MQAEESSQMKEFAKRRKTHADGESWLGKRADAQSVRKKTKKKKKKKKKTEEHDK